MRHALFGAISAGAIAIASAAFSQDATSATGEGWAPADSGWTYQLQLYIWGTEVGGTSDGDDFTIGFDQLMENLNGGIMGGLKAYNGDWMSYGELGYADVGGEKSFTINPGPGQGIDFDGKLDMQTTIVSFGGGYRLVNSPDYTMYGTAGVRYLKLESQLELEGPARVHKVDASDDYWDAVIGLQGEARFGENWFVPWVVDIGAGQSDLTWQLAAGVGYRFNRNDVVFGYRHMEWDLPDDDSVTAYYQSGPMLLWNIRF